MAHQGVVRAFQIDADQIVQQHDVFHRRAVSGAIEKNAGVLVDEALAGAAHGDAADANVRSGDGNGAARAVAIDDGGNRQFRLRMAVAAELDGTALSS